LIKDSLFGLKGNRGINKMSTAQQQVTSQSNWTENVSILQRAIYEILVQKLGMELDPSQINILFSQEAMANYWIPAFTHKTVDAANNYETLEFYGDKVLSNAYSQYLRRRFGKDLDQAIGTLLVNKHMSKMFQAQLARELGLPELMRYDPEEPKVTISVQEDAFESFAGALNNLAEDLIKLGLGYVYIFNMITALFNPIEIKLSEVKRDVKTELKEIYEKMGWGEPNYYTEPSDNPSLGPVKSEIRSKTGQTIGVGYGSKDAAQFDAARQALETLASQGITYESATEEKLKRKRIHNPEFEHQYQRMNDAIDKFNKQLSEKGRVQIKDFKLASIDQRRVGGGMRYTYSLKFAYPTPTGLIWKDIIQRTGKDNDQTQIEVMKEFADRLRVPN
jgi:dsRNA-specific ribonuclease